MAKRKSKQTKRTKQPERTKQTKRDERRTSPREPGQVFACILEESDIRQLDQAFCVVMDVSETGIRLRTPQPPLSSSKVTLRVAVGEDITNLQARVVRVEEVGPSTFDVGLALELDEFHASAFLKAVRENHVQLEMATRS